MLTYSQLYEGVLRKLDKFGSPDIDIPDFNYFMPQAVRNVLTAAIDAAETNQKTTDNIRRLMAKVVYKKEPDASLQDKPLELANLVLPTDYYHLRKRALRITYQLLQAYGRHQSLSEKFTVTATRVDGDQQASASDNYFLRARFRDPHFRVINNRLEIFPAPDAYWEPVTIEAEYFMEPPIVKLEELEDEPNVPTEESANIQTIFPAYMDDQFIEECVRLVQRSTGDERTQLNPGATPAFLT